MDYVEIGDISDESAVKYLTDRKISEKIATVAVNKLTGGRFRQLIAAQNELVDVKDDEKKSLEIIDGEFYVLKFVLFYLYFSLLCLKFRMHTYVCVFVCLF